MSEKPVSQGTTEDLEKHLQAACNLELWTIPLYLTAVSSIKHDESEVPLPDGRGGSTVTRLLNSVAVQEMYHLQLAGNITSLFGYVPRLDWPVYDGRRIPYVSRDLHGVEVRLGTADDENTLMLMVAVEAPGDDKGSLGGVEKDVPVQKTIDYGPDGQPEYDSIGALYSVVAQLAAKFKSEIDPGRPQVANGLFSAWFPHTALLQPATVGEAIDVIVDEGEGAIGHQKAPLEGDAVPDERDYLDPYFPENHFSHEERFELAKENEGNGVTVWPTDGDAGATAQAHLSALFAELLENLRAGWRGKPTDLSPMFLVRGALAQVFMAGELPAFAPVEPGAAGYDAAVDAVAPAVGATWEGNVRWFFCHTDVDGMRANHVTDPDLGDRESVYANQQHIVAATRGVQMPPGELNVWPQEQWTSLENWTGF